MTASVLRPETVTSSRPAISNETAFFLLRDSLAKHRDQGLIHGRLSMGPNHCAIGWLWADNPKLTLHSSFIDEVATVNDSLGPAALPKDRWKKVQSWLRFRIAMLQNAHRAPKE